MSACEVSRAPDGPAGLADVSGGVPVTARRRRDRVFLRPPVGYPGRSRGVAPAVFGGVLLYHVADPALDATGLRGHRA